MLLTSYLRERVCHPHCIAPVVTSLFPRLIGGYHTPIRPLHLLGFRWQLHCNPQARLQGLADGNITAKSNVHIRHRLVTLFQHHTFPRKKPSINTTHLLVWILSNRICVVWHCFSSIILILLVPSINTTHLSVWILHNRICIAWYCCSSPVLTPLVGTQVVWGIEGIEDPNILQVAVKLEHVLPQILWAFLILQQQLHHLCGTISFWGYTTYVNVNEYNSHIQDFL